MAYAPMHMMLYRINTLWSIPPPPPGQRSHVNNVRLVLLMMIVAPWLEEGDVSPTMTIGMYPYCQKPPAKLTEALA